MKRRNFLRHTATTALSLPIIMGGNPIRSYGRGSALEQLLGSTAENDKVLVLIQLNGGNDGLGMVPPIDQYDLLNRARSNVMVAEHKLLKLNHATAFHTQMGALHRLWEKEKLCLVQSVGYPDPNFSHFRSTDIWITGSSSSENLSTGWLGRYMNEEYPGFPEAYPNASNPDPFAVTIGSVVSNTCQGTVGNFGIAIQDPEQFSQLQDGTLETEVPDTPYGHELNFLNQTIRQTNQYAETIAKAWDKSATQSNKYPDPRENRLADQLKIVARMIHGGLQTPIYIVNLGGFDTHANQVLENQDNAFHGRHAGLLADLSQAIGAFQDDIEKMGLADRVIGMTFSEFGRRIASNDSFGTDHGAAAPLILFGKKVNPNIIGSNPVIPNYVAPKQSLPMQFDFRSVYGSVLMDWFNVEENRIRNILFEDFNHVPVITSKESPALGENNFDIFAYPNPFTGSTHIKFELTGSAYVEVDVFNTMGQRIRRLTSRNLGEGRHKILFDEPGLAKGTYHCRVRIGNHVETYTLVKHE